MNVTLEPLEVTHAPALFRMVDENREDVEAWFEWPKRIGSANHASAFIRNYKRDSGIAHWWVTRQSGEIVGMIGFRLREFGYGMPLYVVPSHRRKGLATAMIAQIRQFAHLIGYDDWTPVIDRANAPSQALAESFGVKWTPLQ